MRSRLLVILYVVFISQLTIFVTGQGFGSVVPALNAPNGITVDSAGNIFVIDNGNSRIIKYGPGGNMLAFFTTKTPALSFPNDIAVDTSGSLYVSDTYNARIVKFAPNATVLTIMRPSLVNGFYPYGLALDSAQSHVFVIDRYGHRIVKLTTDGSLVTTFNSSNPTAIDSWGITLDANNAMYITNTGGGVVKYAADGTYLSTFNTSYTNFYPYNVKLDSNNNILLLDWSNAFIVTLYPNGTQAAAVNPAVACYSAVGMFVDVQNMIYISCSDNGQFAKIMPNGTIQQIYTLNQAYDMARDAAGNFYISDVGNSRVIKISNNGVILTNYLSPYSGGFYFYQPHAVALDPRNGNLYVIDGQNGNLYQFANNGTFLSAVTGFSLNFIHMRVNSQGDLYLLRADYLHQSIYRFNSNGQSLGNLYPQPPLLNPGNLAFDSMNYLYVTDIQNEVGPGDRLLKFDTNGIVVETINITFVYGIAVDPSNDTNLYVTNNNYFAKILRYSAVTGTLVSSLNQSSSSTAPVTSVLDVDTNASIYLLSGNQITVWTFQMCAVGFYCPILQAPVQCPAGFYCPPQYVFANVIIACAVPASCPAGSSTGTAAFSTGGSSPLTSSTSIAYQSSTTSIAYQSSSSSNSTAHPASSSSESAASIITSTAANSSDALTFFQRDLVAFCLTILFVSMTIFSAVTLSC